MSSVFKNMVTGIFLFSAAAGAADLNRSITDLQFFPMPNSFYINAGLIGASSASGVGVFGFPSYYSETENQTAVSGTIGYGITKWLSLGFSEGYTFNENQSYTYGPLTTLNGQTQNEVYNGPSDWAIQAAVRLLEQDSAGITGDLVGSYSPGSVPNNQGTTTQTGSLGRGGSLSVVGAKLGRKFSPFEVMVAGSEQFAGTQTSKNLANGQVTSTTGGAVMDVTVAGQLDLSQMFQFILQIDDFLVASSTQTNQSTGTAASVSSYSYLQGTLQVNFQLIPNHLVLQAAYAQTLGQPSATLTTQGVTLNESFNSSSQFGGALLVEF